MRPNISTRLLCPAPDMAGALCSDDCRLSVRLSVSCLNLSRERKGVGSLNGLAYVKSFVQKIEIPL